MKATDIIIFCGQSNMQGQTERLSENEIVATAFEYKFLDDLFVPLQNPVGEDICYDGTRGEVYSDKVIPQEWHVSHQVFTSLTKALKLGHFPLSTLQVGLPRWCSGKESTCQCRRCKGCSFNPWVGKIRWRRKWQPTPAFLPGKFHGQRSLAGYSLWGHKQSDALSTCTHSQARYLVHLHFKITL